MARSSGGVWLVSEGVAGSDTVRRTQSSNGANPTLAARPVSPRQTVPFGTTDPSLAPPRKLCVGAPTHFFRPRNLCGRATYAGPRCP
jgi:hypothetical protein